MNSCVELKGKEIKEITGEERTESGRKRKKRKKDMLDGVKQDKQPLFQGEEKQIWLTLANLKNAN